MPASAANGGAIDWIIWQTGTARLLPRLVKYARVSVDALQRHQAERDRARRR